MAEPNMILESVIIPTQESTEWEIDMEVKYDFCPGKGFYCDGVYLSDFEPRVVRVIHISDRETGIKSIKFVVAVRNINGDMLEEQELESLKNIPYFKLWGCPDSLLTGNQKRLIENKLQSDVMEIAREEVILCPQGVCEGEQGLFMVFGDVVLGKSFSNVDIRIKNPRQLKCQDKKFLMPGEISKTFIEFLPGVTEMLFYGALFTIVRPFMSCVGYNPDFMLALIGPSGHLKTTLMRKYALWLEEETNQEMTFRDYGRFDDVLKRVDSLVGQNFLADDLHMAGSRSSSERQSERLDILCRHISRVKQCAQIVLTGEQLEGIGGIFSCRDRILQIRVPRMTSQELANVKKKLNEKFFEDIPRLALKFAETLISNQEILRGDIEDFLNSNMLLDAEKDYSLRISQHATCLKLTEFLYRKYVLASSEEYSCKKQLYDAIDRNYAIQSRELMYLRKEAESDIVVDLYNMLRAGYLEGVSDLSVYRQYTTSSALFYMVNNIIYVTRNVLQSAMNKYLGRTCSARKLSDAMHDAGILEEDADARTKKFNSSRHYVINRTLLEEYCKNKMETTEY